MSRATTPEAYKLLHEGLQTLSRIESNGIRIDTDYLEGAIGKTKRRIANLYRSLEEDEVTQVWKTTFGRSANFNSREQLGEVLFNRMGHACVNRTPTGRPRTDEESLSSLSIPYVKRFLKISKLQKALSTYLYGIQKETVDGFLHPIFSLHLVSTFRGSSERPNFQNIPIRLEWIADLIRQAFIPRVGHALVELDYSGIEVGISCCYHHDPRLTAYVEDLSLDMHRDMAAECYMMDTDQVTKQLRYGGKNKFIFPQFYGDYYINCARNLWDHIVSGKLSMKNGTLVTDHLKEQGITRLGACDPKQKPKARTFEKHIQEVEANFWGSRFKVYAEWKEKWWSEYQKNGGWQTLTGFIENGVFKRNEAINAPIQGSAFHCLLWSLTRLQKWIERNRSGAKIVGQIHDSIVADVPVDEVQDYLAAAKKIMTRDLARKWKWISVPLRIDAEIAYEGQSWNDKKEIKIEN